MTLGTINASFDPDAPVSYAIDGDIPDLCADAETIDAVALKAAAMLPDLLVIHAVSIEPSQLIGPHRVRIIGHDEREFNVAA